MSIVLHIVTNIIWLIYIFIYLGGWIFADDIGNHHAELSKTNSRYSMSPIKFDNTR